MRIILVDPGFLGEYGFGKWGKAYWSSAINHGIAQISAVCKRQGISCLLADFRKMTSYGEFREFIEKNKTDWYGITCRTIDVPVVKNAAKIIKEVNCYSKIVVGGIHPSIHPEEFLTDPSVDYVFTGEADESLPQLMSKPDQFTKLVRGLVPDINKAPAEDHEIYDYKTSISFSLYGGIIKAPMVPVITSRGCVYNCKFCQPAERILYGKKYRQKDVDKVIHELDLISGRYFFKSIMFYDDCLLAHKDYLFES